MQLTVAELKKLNPKYKDHIQQWKLYMAAYKGIESIIKGAYLPKHEREEESAYKRRMDELYGFGYSKSVVGIFTFHLLNKPPQGRKLKDIETDDFWNMFFEDANLYGDSYDTTIASMALYASIQGHMGILVDKSPGKFENLQEQKDAKVYPYIAAYHPPAILDWTWEKDKNNRPILAMVKLKDEDGRYRVWTLKEWGIFDIRDESGEEKGDQELISADQTDVNPLGFIPFLWYYNIKSNENAIGESDLSEIAKIDISLIKNASQIEEVIYYAAFPMLMKPSRNAKPDVVAGTQQEDVVGTKAVIEYDPEYPESKPQWLTPEVKSAIEAILEAMKFKIAEIYRAANIGGLAGTEIQTQPKSGTALKSEFQILNAALVSKALNLEKAENRILEFWLKWENKWDDFKERVNFGRSKSFDVENIAIDLANALTAKTVVMSKTFNSMLQKQTARQVLPSMSEDDRIIIDEEIDQYIEATPDPGKPDPKIASIDNAPEDDKKIINKAMQED